MGSVQARCRPPILVHTSLVVQSTQVEPIAVHGVHRGYQGADASHGGIQGFTPPAAPGGPAPGTAAATATWKVTSFIINSLFGKVLKECETSWQL